MKIRHSYAAATAPINHMLQQGFSDSYIAEELAIPKQVVSYRRRKLLEVITPAPTTGLLTPPQTRYERAEQMLRQGASNKEVAAACQMSETAVSNMNIIRRQTELDPATRHVPEKRVQTTLMMEILTARQTYQQDRHPLVFEFFSNPGEQDVMGDLTKIYADLGCTVTVNVYDGSAETDVERQAIPRLLGSGTKYDAGDIDPYGGLIGLECIPLMLKRLKPISLIMLTIPGTGLAERNDDNRWKFHQYLGTNGDTYQRHHVVEYVRKEALKKQFRIIGDPHVVSMDRMWRFGFQLQHDTIENLKRDFPHRE
jgi:hypothetical protein